MLGIIGTILNLIVIIFVYIYTTLWMAQWALRPRDGQKTGGVLCVGRSVTGHCASKQPWPTHTAQSDAPSNSIKGHQNQPILLQGADTKAQWIHQNSFTQQGTQHRWQGTRKDAWKTALWHHQGVDGCRDGLSQVTDRCQVFKKRNRGGRSSQQTQLSPVSQDTCFLLTRWTVWYQKTTGTILDKHLIHQKCLTIWYRGDNLFFLFFHWLDVCICSYQGL